MYYDSACKTQDIMDLNDWFWNMLYETAHWIIPPSSVAKSSKILLELWLDRIDFVSKWVKSLFKLYDYKSASIKFQELRIITDPLEVGESNTFVFINNRQVQPVHFQFFSLLRILNRTVSFEDLILMFDSGSTAFMAAAVESIGKEMNMDALELDETQLNQITKV